MTVRPSRLRMAGVHHQALRAHLFPGDGYEAVAFALCGRHTGKARDYLLVQELHLIPYADCSVRAADRITWRTDSLEPVLRRAAELKLGVVKFHSHPTDYPAFSAVDDQSDRELFPSVFGWVDDEGPHASVVMQNNGRMFGRAVTAAGEFGPLDRILIAGDAITVHRQVEQADLPSHAERHAQLFGAGTATLIRQLKVGVVGCSGTGGFVIEMLARLGVKGLVLVDSDRVEYRNLNRIVGAT